MRELKFRAWSSFIGKMIPIGYFHGDKGYETARDLEDGLPVQGSEIMQFINRLDKRNQEIYEGDIIRVNKGLWSERIEDCITKVEFVDGAFGFHEGVYNTKYGKSSLNDFCSINDYDSGDIEKIGNIYENSNILDVK